MAAVTASFASWVAVMLAFVSEPPGIVLAPKTILALGMVASAISVVALPTRSVTVFFYVSLALVSAMGKKSPAARLAPASVASSLILR
ncbi:MAG: hypothetical protein ACK5XN_00315, partial [Bacteroidota bacterium]